MCFYCIQSDILLCGIARFSRGNKNKLKHFSLKKEKKLRTASLKQNLLVLLKKKSVMGRHRNKDFTINTEKHTYMKIIVTIIPTNVVTNTLVTVFLPFRRNQKNKSRFQKN